MRIPIEKEDVPEGFELCRMCYGTKEISGETSAGCPGPERCPRCQGRGYVKKKLDNPES